MQEIGDLLVKLPDWKVVQTESVGASLLPRLNLLAPPAGGKAAEKNDGMGTQLELSDKGGKQLGSVLLGKIVTKILGNDDPRTRPDDRVTHTDSGNLVGRLVTKILRR